MSLLMTTSLEQIEERHLLALIDNKVQEGRDLDFKRDPIGRDDKAKREFLKDITAFANTAGGHLVIGMEEADGIAAALCGISFPSADEEIRRLDSIIEAGIEPRLVGLRIRPIPLAAGGFALIIQIQVSWNPPHRVIFGGWNRFFARNSGGAYELSVEQLRAVFLGGAEFERRLMNFRVERLARLEAGERGPALSGEGKLLIQGVPLTQSAASDLVYCQRNLVAFMPPGRNGGLDYRFNLDGFLIYAGSTGGTPPAAYTQIFRDGRIEMARGGYCWRNTNPSSPQCVTTGAALNADLYDGVERIVDASAKLSVMPPIAIMVSFIGVTGSIMTTDPLHPGWGFKPLDRDALLLEAVVIETATSTDGWQRALKPMFDSLWNAYGFGRSGDLFDDNGEWRGIPAGWR